MARGYHEGKDPTKMTVMDAYRLAGNKKKSYFGVKEFQLMLDIVGV